MILYPAIDLKDGKCVRLSQGKFDNVTEYTDQPQLMAAEFVAAGAQYIHVVDLDGANDGVRKNADAIRQIVGAAGSVAVQLGGGIRDMASLEAALELGVSRVIIGTAAVGNPDFVVAAVAAYGERVAVGIDAKDGFAATHGWEQVSDERAVALAQKMQACGVKTIIYTDIATDGMLAGPNLAAMKEMTAATDCNIIASGGVSSKDDVVNLLETGVAGVIIGKAIYAGRLDLADTIETISQKG